MGATQWGSGRMLHCGFVFEWRQPLRQRAFCDPWGPPLLGGKEAFLGIRRGATQMLSLLAGRMFVAELGLSGGL